jgi:hypothetical protein
MTVSIRFYIFADAGLQRVSQRVMDGLAHGQDAMPQFAGTKQKLANVIVDLEEGKPARITRADGSFLHFDTAGNVHESLVNSGFEAMETFDALERSKRIKSKSKVVDLSPKLKREKWERDNRWTLSKQDLDLISDDIWKRKRAGHAEGPASQGRCYQAAAVDVRGEAGHSRNPDPYFRYRRQDGIFDRTGAKGTCFRGSQAREK